MIVKRLFYMFAVALAGAALLAEPASAAARGFGGHGGMRAGGGFGGARIGGGFGGARMGVARVGGYGVARVGGYGGYGGYSAFRAGGVRLAGRPFYGNRGFYGHNRFFARRFVRPFYGVGLGVGLYAGYSCWRWVPSYYGLTRVWACGYPSAYGYGGYGYRGYGYY